MQQGDSADVIANAVANTAADTFNESEIEKTIEEIRLAVEKSARITSRQ